MAQSLCPEDINWIRYLVHSYFHIVPIDTVMLILEYNLLITNLVSIG